MADTKLAEILKKWYLYDVKTQKINYVEDTDPTTSVNPEEKNVVWYNRKSGEIFICIDNTPDKNKWRGTNGTIIAPTTLNKFDFFEDSSTIAVFNFDGNLDDLGGLHKGEVSDRRYGPIYDVGRYGKAVKSKWNLYNIKVKIPELEKYDVITVSAWLNWNGWSCCVMPFGFRVYDIYTCCSAFGFNTGNGDIYGIRRARQELYNKGWFHFVAEFHKGDVHSNKMWINGKKRDLEQIYSYPRNNIATFGDTFYIFGWGANRSYRHFGLADQIRLFNRPLTDEEVLELYNER